MRQHFAPVVDWWMGYWPCPRQGDSKMMWPHSMCTLFSLWQPLVKTNPRTPILAGSSGSAGNWLDRWFVSMVEKMTKMPRLKSPDVIIKDYFKDILEVFFLATGPFPFRYPAQVFCSCPMSLCWPECKCLWPLCGIIVWNGEQCWRQEVSIEFILVPPTKDHTMD